MNRRLPTPIGPERFPAVGHGTPPRPDAEAGELDLPRFRSLIARRWRSIVGVTVVAVLAASVYTLLVAPVWDASALIRVDEKEGGLIAPSGLEALTNLAGGGEIETEMRMLRTRPTAEDVVDELDLHVRVEDPKEIPRELLFASLEFGRNTIEAEYSIRPAVGGRYRIRAAGGDTPPLDREFAPGEPIEIPGGTLVLADLARGRDREGDPLPTSVDLETVLFQEAVEDLFEDMSVTRPDRDADVIRVGYRSTDIVLAAEVPNAMAQAFIRRRDETNRADARSTVGFLSEQVEDTRVRLEAVEEEMRGFREGEQIVALDAEAEAQVERLARLETERTGLDTERAALSELISDIEQGSGPPDYRRLASFPTFFRNDAVAGILEELIQADRARNEFLVRFTPNHPDVIALDERIDQLEGQLASIGRNYLGSIERQIAALDDALGRFGSELERVPARQIRFARLLRQADLLSELYKLLSTRLKEAEVAAAIDDSSVRIVEYAIQALEPDSPRPVRNLALAAVLGLMLGLALAYLRDAADPRLQPTDRIEDLYGVPTMARIPSLAVRNGLSGRDGLVVAEASGSVAAESYRSLRTNVGFVRGGEGASEIVVASPSPDGGSSVAAANLAVALAQRGRSTLLIDADMHQPSQHRLFRLPAGPGWRECLEAGEVVDGAVRPTHVPGLSLLAAGERPAHPAELLDNPGADGVLDALRARFDALILVAPPVLPVADATILAPRTHGVILVVRAGVTDKGEIARAIEQLRRGDAVVLGVVVGDAEPEGSYPGYLTTAGDRPRGGLRALIRRHDDAGN
ncbi:MAG TPA: polysaccharide biosynthesis tyrosine autokinase [Longimicrobiales bacterium]|nr:polysaccharide biosynthesis tyrosine autokinase [Longimicrobiales bacterium]